MMTTATTKTRAAIIGTAGFASSHHEAMRTLEDAGEAQLVCTCDVSAELLAAADARFDLAKRGVRVYTDYAEMLDAHRGELDVVTVPTGIPLHASMHRACVERGLPCYLEKPPTLDPDELERMIAVDSGAAKATQVAFNFIVEAERQTLKKRILSGEFGAVRRVSYRILWPRPTSYFTRNSWAGRLVSGDTLILDSCVGNAMAHYTHNLLFWAGTGELFSWASPVEVEADLYRARPIETFDTAFIRAKLDTGAALRIAASHACAGNAEQWERVECEDAAIVYVVGNRYAISSRDGRTVEEKPLSVQQNLLPENFRAYFGYVRDNNPPRPMTRLVDSRPFVHLNNLAFLSANRITSVGAAHIQRVPNGESDSDAFFAIHQIREASAAFAATGAFPREMRLPWARTGETPQIARPEDLPRLRETVAQMASE